MQASLANVTADTFEYADSEASGSKMRSDNGHDGIASGRHKQSADRSFQQFTRYDCNPIKFSTTRN